MNEPVDKHAPTQEFVDYLARDTMRRLRHEARFAPQPEPRMRSRIPTTLAIAAGVFLTLSTGMVLGASANYASAAVLPNGTTTIPAKPPLAILPIRNALSAIGCTQPAEPVAKPKAAVAARAADTTQTSSSSPAAVAPPLVDSVSRQQRTPDRAAVASLVRQHASPVIRGDTAVDYVVIAVDATQKYLWSTFGNGNVSIEVGADKRTLAEHNEYNRKFADQFGAPLGGDTKSPAFAVDSGLAKAGQRRDADSTVRRYYSVRRLNDSAGTRGLFFIRGFARVSYSGAGTGCTPAATATTRPAGGSGDAAQDLYSAFWTVSRRDVRCNQAFGLQLSGEGESGIMGLPSNNVAMADIYSFNAGELAARELKVIFVQVTPGAPWAAKEVKQRMDEAITKPLREKPPTKRF